MEDLPDDIQHLIFKRMIEKLKVEELSKLATLTWTTTVQEITKNLKTIFNNNNDTIIITYWFIGNDEAGGILTSNFKIEKEKEKEKDIFILNFKHAGEKAEKKMMPLNKVAEEIYYETFLFGIQHADFERFINITNLLGNIDENIANLKNLLTPILTRHDVEKNLQNAILMKKPQKGGGKTVFQLHDRYCK